MSKKVTAEAMRANLLRPVPSASHSGAIAFSDPIGDQPMILTLDQLRPFDNNPRLSKNPLYEDIKASILKRGLDNPPPVTRRPGETYYIIRNGGNTRLAILNELWTETKEERFFRIPVLFKPWKLLDANGRENVAIGELDTLVGHLAENALRSDLTFIEKALGVAKARALYEQQEGAAISQRELARRLEADGFPIDRSNISRMEAAIQYLYPCIPNLLTLGMGRPQIEQLLKMRSGAWEYWRTFIPQPEEREGLFQLGWNETLQRHDNDEEAALIALANSPEIIRFFTEDLAGWLSRVTRELNPDNPEMQKPGTRHNNNALLFLQDRTTKEKWLEIDAELASESAAAAIRDAEREERRLKMEEGRERANERRAAEAAAAQAGHTVPDDNRLNDDYTEEQLDLIDDQAPLPLSPSVQTVTHPGASHTPPVNTVVATAPVSPAAPNPLGPTPTSASVFPASSPAPATTVADPGLGFDDLWLVDANTAVAELQYQAADVAMVMAMMAGAPELVDMDGEALLGFVIQPEALDDLAPPAARQLAQWLSLLTRTDAARVDFEFPAHALLLGDLPDADVLRMFRLIRLGREIRRRTQS
ncbi:ParB family protein [Pokkaliibacter plantistimulans]|uniref:ParB family protein n=1 Tax=Pokkaliibacter plantistimulans TaxID=1635171 RepID=UPI00268B2375